MQVVGGMVIAPGVSGRALREAVPQRVVAGKVGRRFSRRYQVVRGESELRVRHRDRDHLCAVARQRLRSLSPRLQDLGVHLLHVVLLGDADSEALKQSRGGLRQALGARALEQVAELVPLRQFGVRVEAGHVLAVGPLQRRDGGDSRDHLPGDDTRAVQRAGVRYEPRSRQPPIRRLEAGQPAVGRRQPHRPPRVRADSQQGSPRRNRSG